MPQLAALALSLALLLFLTPETHSIQPNVPAACTQIPETGLCFAALQRYFFDLSTQRCTMFIYGGCLGSVPFETRRDCHQARCRRNRCFLAPDVGRCEEVLPRWFFNAEIQECDTFSWSGCGGVVPFSTRSDCERARCADKVH